MTYRVTTKQVTVEEKTPVTITMKTFQRPNGKPYLDVEFLGEGIAFAAAYGSEGEFHASALLGVHGRPDRENISVLYYSNYNTLEDAIIAVMNALGIQKEN